ncbi:hypothetical protein [Alkalimarinus coralli]|uniref:hypothetical protein n=1 Tax=Alkalimarinus coralli TaxID=2935863 RepID=UPI00202B3E28|nr:hypothetical protein [Alkalimarinus coralli]
MFKQMRQWQNAFTITLILLCVGIGIGHNIEATLDSDHGEHCSICISGNSSPAVSNLTTPLDNFAAAAIINTASTSSAYQRQEWPGYATRAPPLV